MQIGVERFELSGFVGKYAKPCVEPANSDTRVLTVLPLRLSSAG